MMWVHVKVEKSQSGKTFIQESVRQSLHQKMKKKQEMWKKEIVINKKGKSNTNSIIIVNKSEY